MTTAAPQKQERAPMQISLEISDPKIADYLQTVTEQEFRVMMEGTSAIDPPSEELLAILDKGLAQADRGETHGPFGADELIDFLDQHKK